MNIFIDLRWMVLGHAGGLEQMAYELVAALAEFDDDNTFYLYCSDRIYYDWLFSEDSNMKLIDSNRFLLVPERSSCEQSDKCTPSTFTKLGIVPSDDTGASPSIISIDLVHSIGGYVNDEFLNYRNILTVHDLQHIHQPYHFEDAEIAGRNARYLTSIRTSEAIICVSEFVKYDVIVQFGLKPENVFTVWNIPSGDPLKEISNSKVSRMLMQMGVDFEYIYYPSHGWPHKNHKTLVEAFLLIRESFPELKMIFTGGKFDGDHPATKKIKSLGLSDSIKHIGYRTPTEVQCLYKGAKAVVYPSLFEGFGMPVAEAIVADTPVVCSDIKPLVEVGGEAVVTFDPSDPEDIAGKVISVLQDYRLREELLRRGKEQKKRFSGKNIAYQTSNIYRSCCGLDPLVEKDYRIRTAIRCESTRHWGRVCERELKAGHHFSGIISFLVTALLSWPLARAIYGSLKRENTILENDFHGRYGDGWIGARYRDWFMIPKGAKVLELEFGAPPSPHVDNVEFRINFETNEIGVFKFEEDSTLKVSIDLKDSAGELSQLKINVNNTFRPNEHDGNGDERKLGIKLLGIRWILVT